MATDKFVPQTAPDLVDLLSPDPNTPAIADILRLAFSAGLTACLKSDQFRSEMAWDVNLTTLQTVHRIDARVLELVDSIESTHCQQAALLETTLIQMAKRIAIDVNHQSSALAELDLAVDIAQRLQGAGEVPSNHPDFVDAVFKRVAELNKVDDLDLGAEALEAALAQEKEKSKARQSRILEGLIGQ
ncbi:MAG: hypothetical protein AAGI09_13975 [Pseudomonadota bacterium]